jgi:small GTP-binding protein
MENSKYDEIIKISIVGDAGNGKTSLMKRFINDEFYEESTSTMGIDCAFKIINIDIKNNNIENNNIEKKRIKLKIWDTAGQEKFGEIIRSCYRDSDGVIITYDTTNYKSFLNLKKWIEKVSVVIDIENIIIMIVGTKTDLIDNREVSEHQIFDFVHNNHLKYIEVSAKDRKNVNLLFEIMTRSILEKGTYKNNCIVKKITFKNNKDKDKNSSKNTNWCGFF